MWLELLSIIDEMIDQNEIGQFDQIDMEKLQKILNCQVEIKK
jgi:hypothetical protein